MSNAADAVYLHNGLILHTITDVNIDPDGGESTPLRGMTPTKKAFGWRHGQIQSGVITFNMPILETGPEVDYLAKQETKEEFTWSEQGDTWTRNFIKTVVQDVKSTTDDAGHPTHAVSLAYLYEVRE